jgi:patatin-like phospholipase/acyl hydrolase
MALTCRILSIDGGGIRGLLPARVLETIEERTGQGIARHFNLLAGTSTGGLLALGLGTPRPGGSQPFTAAEMVKLYQKKGPKIFAQSLWHSVTSLGAVTDERYDSDNIEDILKDLLKNRKLSDCLAEVDILVPSYEIERRIPYFFKSWHARGEPPVAGEKPAERDFLAREVARATSAAPTYFQPAKVKSMAGESYAFIDGGVFANNPGMAALVAARWLYPQAEAFEILSLGTGTMERPIPYEDAKNWGLMGWARPVISVMMGGNSATVHYQLREIADTFKVAVHYNRFEIDLGQDPDDLNAVNDDFDDASPGNMAALMGKADDLLKTFQVELEDLISRLQSEPKTNRAVLRGVTPV